VKPKKALILTGLLARKQAVAVGVMGLRREWLAVILIAVWALVGAIPLDACLLGACQDGCSMHGLALAPPGERTGLSDRGPCAGLSEMESAACACGKIDVSSSATIQPAQESAARQQASACAVLPSASPVSPSFPRLSHQERSQRVPADFTRGTPGTRAPPSA